MEARAVTLVGGIQEAGRPVDAWTHSRRKGKWIVASHVMGRLSFVMEVCGSGGMGILAHGLEALDVIICA